MRHFHSYGPVDPAVHFAVPRNKLVEGCVQQLLGAPGEGGHYFTIWAPRQTGKTWLMRRARDEIRARYGERFIVGTLSMQGVMMAKDEPPEAFLRRVPMLLRNGFKLNVPEPSSWESFKDLFSVAQQIFPRPVILLIDEFDKLPPVVIDHLVGLFRDIYLDPENHLLHGLALVGVRAVLGIDSQRGSPFNIQRSLHVPPLMQEEVTELYHQYQHDSGQAIDAEVVAKVYEVTRGHPGLVSWFGELLTEKYNRPHWPASADPREVPPFPPASITMANWDQVYAAARQVEPNNTVLNLLKKAQRKYPRHLLRLFSTSDVPFSFGQSWCNYLYMNGIVDFQEITGRDGHPFYVCRFFSPYVQLRLYTDLASQIGPADPLVPTLDPRDDLKDVLGDKRINIPALLQRYRDYLARLKARGLDPWTGQARRADLHFTEAAGHFHLYWWLKEAVGRQVVIVPEFPTGNGKVDLLLRTEEWSGVIEVKSFTHRHELPAQREQAARYAKSRGLTEAILAVFVPTEDEELLRELSDEQDCADVRVTTIAISQGA